MMVDSIFQVLLVWKVFQEVDELSWQATQARRLAIHRALVCLVLKAFLSALAASECDDRRSLTRSTNLSPA